MINTPTGSGARSDGWEIRRAAVAARDPLHHDALRRPGRRARDPRGARRRAGGRLAAGGPRGALTRAVRSPPARRARAAARSGPTSCWRSRDPRARARAGPVLHARRGGALGRGRGRAAVPRPRDLGHALGDDGLVEFLLEDVGPGTRRLCELEAGEELLLVGPLGRGFSRRRTPDDAARRRRASASRRSLAVAGALGRHGAARLPRRRSRARPPRSSASPRSPPTTAPPATTASSPTCSTPRSPRRPRPICACGPPAMLARGASSAPRRRECRRSSRSRRRWPAGSAPATAASSRPSTATGGPASTGPCSTRRCSRDRVLRDRAAPSA